MRLVQCEHGHYYDADTYASCPHCNPDTPASENAGRTVNMPPAEGGGDRTLDLKNADNDETERKTEKRSGETPAVDPYIPPAVPEVQPETNIPLPQAGTQIPLPSDNSQTAGYYGGWEEKGQKEPVTGWLVCIRGIYKGRSFQLKSGRNFIGRGADMDVSLPGEKTVSRGRHAILIYEPKNRIFLAQPGDAHELFYVNDEVVLDPVVLKPYDLISLGKVDLRFVPFCTEQFAWEDLEEEEDEAGSLTAAKE